MRPHSKELIVTRSSSLYLHFQMPESQISKACDMAQSQKAHSGDIEREIYVSGQLDVFRATRGSARLGLSIHGAF